MRRALLIGLLGLVGCGKGLSINPRARGYVTVTSGTVTVGAMKAGATSVVAAFFDDPMNTGSFTSTASGPCLLIDSRSVGGPPTRVSAGPLTITGGIKPIMVTPTTDATHTYTYTDNMASLWKGGEMITVSAQGAVVPGFTATAVASSSVDFAKPTAPAQGTPLMIDRMADLPIYWTGGSVGVVHVTFVVAKSTLTLDCTFPASAGTGNIPRSALFNLPIGAQGSISVGGGEVFANIVEAGGYTVQIQILSLATWGGNQPISPTFQAMN